ncbi:MAG: prepilin peptidase [Weissella confusa]
MSIYDLPFIIALCSLTVQDLKQCLIDSRLLAPAFLLGVTHHDSHPVTAFIIYVCALIINHHYREKFLGNGDLDVIFVGALHLSPDQLPLWLTISCGLHLPISFGNQLSHYPSYQP